jgi:hypothetical protein
VDWRLVLEGGGARGGGVDDKSAKVGKAEGEVGNVLRGGTW